MSKLFIYTSIVYVTKFDIKELISLCDLNDTGSLAVITVQ